MAKVIIAGLDGSLRNFGLVKCALDLETLGLEVISMELFKTEKSKIKTIRSSSDNLARAQSIATGIRTSLKDVSTVFAEVPSGGQSYDAVLGFGIVIGLYAGITVPINEVSPTETKLAALGTKTASKQEMIDWATEKYPLAPWRKTKRKGEMVPTLDNEHLADAIGVMEAGIKTPAFRSTLAMLRGMHGLPAAA